MSGPFNINSISQTLSQQTQQLNEVSTSTSGLNIKYDTAYGILGNGTDETTKLQALFNAAVGGVVVFTPGITIKFNGQITIPRRITIVGNGASLERITPSNTHAIKVLGDLSASYLNLPTPGGTANDKGVLITGSNVHFTKLRMIATAEGNVSNTSWAVEVDAGGSTYVDNIKFDAPEFANWKTCIFVKRCTRLKINDIDANTYRLAIYLIDTKRSRITGGRIYGQTSTSTGGPGENGVLIEATTQYATDDIKIKDLTVEDSGEHGYRLGGQASMRNIKFIDCISVRPGRSIYVGYASATEWHGGSGFKALGATTVAGQRHKNIKFIRCITEDCSTLTGTFPAGHGINNYSAFNIFCCEDVQIVDCYARKSDGATYSSLQAFIVGASSNVQVRNFQCDATSRDSFLIHDEPVGYVGWELPVVGLYVTGGKMICGTNNAVIKMHTCRYAQADWKFTNIDCRGGSIMIRLETPQAGGTYGNDFFVSGHYQDSNVDDSISTSPIIQGVTAFRAEVSGPWRPASYSASVLNGSKFVDTLTGDTRIRTGGAWAIQ